MFLWALVGVESLPYGQQFRQNIPGNIKLDFIEL